MIAQQATNSDGTAASSAVLFGDGTMRDIMTRIEQVLGSSVGGLTMSDLGLSFNTNKNELAARYRDAVDHPQHESERRDGVAVGANHDVIEPAQRASTPATSPQSFTLDVTVDSSGNLDGRVRRRRQLAVHGQRQHHRRQCRHDLCRHGLHLYRLDVAVDHGDLDIGHCDADRPDRQGRFDTSSGSLQTLINSLQTQDSAMQQKVNDIDSAAAAFQTQLRAQIRQVPGGDPERQQHAELSLGTAQCEVKQLTQSRMMTQSAMAYRANQAYRGAAVTVPPLRAVIMLLNGAITFLQKSLQAQEARRFEEGLRASDAGDRDPARAQPSSRLRPRRRGGGASSSRPTTH